MPDSSRRTLPDFLLIGTQRGGTTALFSYLVAHPLVRRPLRKEMHYFDRFYPLGAAWYQAHFPLNEVNRDWITGEATADYLYDPEAPGRARLLLHSTKIIALLRDPVVRAHSAWKLMTRKGRERRPFQQAIRDELAQIQRNRRRMPFVRLPKAYLERGNYAVQLRRWTDAFGADALLTVMSNDLFAEPSSTYGHVLDFLELPPFDGVDFVVHHATEESRVDPELRKLLMDHYRESNLALADVLGRELPW